MHSETTVRFVILTDLFYVERWKQEEELKESFRDVYLTYILRQNVWFLLESVYLVFFFFVKMPPNNIFALIVGNLVDTESI